MEQLEQETLLRAVPIEDTGRLRVIASADHLAIQTSRSRTIEVAPNSVKPVLSFAGISTAVAEKLRPSTLGLVLTELMVDRKHCALLVRNNQVADIAPYGKFHPVNPERVLTIVEKAIPEADFHRVLNMPNHVTRFEVVGVEERPVVKGDMVRAGVMVNFSPIGIVMPSVQSFVMRLACTNGATSTQVLREFGGGGGEGDDIWHWFRQSIRSAYKSIDPIVDGWKVLRDRKISPEDRAALLEALIKDAKLPLEAAMAVRNRALQEVPQNEYDMLNLITWASSHLLEDPREIDRAQRAAADFASAEAHRRVCPTCNRAR